jgi:hypothetical protein
MNHRRVILTNKDSSKIRKELKEDANHPYINDDDDYNNYDYQYKNRKQKRMCLRCNRIYWNCGMRIIMVMIIIIMTLMIMVGWVTFPISLPNSHRHHLMNHHLNHHNNNKKMMMMKGNTHQKMDSNIIYNTLTTNDDNSIIIPRDPMQLYTRKLEKYKKQIQIRIQPTLGKHTYSQDAIFVIANTDDFETYVLFLNTLRTSGFQGDVVLSVPKLSTLSEPLLTFLKFHSNHYGLVLYDDVIRLEHNDAQVILNETHSNDNHDDSSCTVYLKGIYGYSTSTSSTSSSSTTSSHHPPLEDMRPPRALGIAKYELYWIWSKQYSSTSHILLLDTIHDVYFQQGAQIGIGLRRTCTNTNTNTHQNSRLSSDELHLYEEKHVKNRRVIHAPASTRNGQIIHNTYGHRTILSPLSTHGHQTSIQAYLTAMIHRFDDTHCVEYQCEWAFHNHLYYSGILQKLPDINVRVHLQGTFAVNSVGLDVPLRSSPMVHISEGTFTIMNRPMGEGIYPSWAVHQYVQDPELHVFIQNMKQRMVQELDSSLIQIGNAAAITTVNDLNSKWNVDHTFMPVLGKHRPEKDAIFTVIPRMQDDKHFQTIQTLILSARNSGFEGDIVLHIPHLQTIGEEMVNFFNAQTNIVLYEGLFDDSPQNGIAVSLMRHSRRGIKVIAFDIYLLWIQKYDPTSSVMILDGEEINYFQSNPFVNKSCYTFEIHFYSEHNSEKKFFNMEEEDDFISDRIMHVLTSKRIDRMKEEKVVIPHALFGHVEILQSIIVDMLNGFDKFSCYGPGCDWAIINYLWYGPLSQFGKGINYKTTIHNQGTHVIHPIYTSNHNELQKRGLYDEKQKVYKNWDGSISPVVMRYTIPAE